MIVWFGLTCVSLIFVAVDIRRMPVHPVLKWAFVILTFFTGPLGAFFYVLGCREPLQGTHEQFVAARWRQVLGSTMHCAAGDGLGIIAGAALAAYWRLPRWGDLALEYGLGFGFGWAFFQAFAMREMAGSYRRSLRLTLFPEFVSMNLLMAGMIVTMRLLMARIPGAVEPPGLSFWFVMDMAIIAGFVLAYPMNWWLVAHQLKHGMITVRPGATHSDRSANATPLTTDNSAMQAKMSRSAGQSESERHRVPLPQRALVTVVSVAVLWVSIYWTR